MLRKILRPLCFALCLCLCLCGVHRVLAFQDYDGAYILRNFYAQEEDSIDVIHLGSSSVYVNINPAVLWEEYGIASYNLTSSMQSIAMSYYYLEEALKTQSPDLVVLDVFRVLETYEYPYITYSIKAVSGMRFSQTKIDAITASFSEEWRLDYLLGFPASHGRYDALSQTDFMQDYSTQTADVSKGYYMLDQTRTVTQTDVSGVEQATQLPEQIEEYLNKIIALTKEEGIELLLIKTPYGISESEQAYYNAVAQIAAAAEVPFVNFNVGYDDIGLDYTQDFADYVHMNAAGSEKFSQYYAAYLAQHYDLPDHQGEAAYASYDEAYTAWKRSMYAISLGDAADWDSYLRLLQGGDYTVVCVLSYFDGDTTALYQCLGAQTADAFGFSYNTALVQEGDSIALCAIETKGFHWAADTGDTTIFTLTQAEDAYAPSVQYNADSYALGYDAVHIFVFDTQKNALVSAVSFDESLTLTNRMV